MSRADFYILPQSSSPHRFACTIANKAWLQGNRIYIAARSREEAAQLDDLLWTFHDISFMPHALGNDIQAENAPVTVGWPDIESQNCEVLINLTGELPDISRGFDRIIEIVAPEDKRQARQRYRQYREMGIELHSHDMNSENAHA